jgi:hypothetical protein
LPHSLARLNPLGIDLGSTATIILLTLGAILVASYAIQSFKISASGVEIQTREQTSAPVQFSIDIPKIDYVKIACYLAVFAFILLGIILSLLPPAH